MSPLKTAKILTSSTLAIPKTTSGMVSPTYIPVREIKVKDLFSIKYYWKTYIIMNQMLLVSTFFKKYKNDCPFFLAKKFYIKIYYE